MTPTRAFVISTTLSAIPHSITVAHLTPGKAKSWVVAVLRKRYPAASFASIRSCRRAPELDAVAAAPGAVLAWVSGDDKWEAKR
jgi:hypothetical protein